MNLPLPLRGIFAMLCRKGGLKRIVTKALNWAETSHSGGRGDPETAEGRTGSLSASESNS